MNRKAKGSRNERRTMRLLEAAGYSCTRAAASLGTFDVIAVSAADVLLVQVKTNEWPRHETRGIRPLVVWLKTKTGEYAQLVKTGPLEVELAGEFLRDYTLSKASSDGELKNKK